MAISASGCSLDLICFSGRFQACKENPLLQRHFVAKVFHLLGFSVVGNVSGKRCRLSQLAKSFYATIKSV